MYRHPAVNGRDMRILARVSQFLPPIAFHRKIIEGEGSLTIPPALQGC